MQSKRLHIANLIRAMISYDHGDPMRIHHFLKVHDFAMTIGLAEGLTEDEMFTLEAAAVVHDIGIHISEEKYGSSAGHYQEIEGAAEARALMSSVGGFAPEVVERVAYLVGHHHTYTDIDGMDYQILVEADFLVNIYEDNISEDAARSVSEKIFRTATGRQLLNEIYLHPRES